MTWINVVSVHQVIGVQGLLTESTLPLLFPKQDPALVLESSVPFATIPFLTSMPVILGPSDSIFL